MNERQKPLGVPRVNFEVLGRDFIRERRRFLQVLHDDDSAAVLQRIFRDFLSGKKRALTRGLRRQNIREYFVVRQHDRAGTPVVLRLRKHVRSHICRIRRTVRDDENFARPRQHVYPHLTVNVLFRKRHVNVPRPRHDVDFRDALGAAGKRRHSLRSAHLEHRFHPAFLRRHQRRGMNFSVLRGRRHINVLHPRRLRGQNAHQNRRKQRRGAAGNINARALHRTQYVTRRPARFVRADVSFRLPAGMIFQNPLLRAAERREQIGLYRRIRLRKLLLAHAESIFRKAGTVEFFFIAEYRFVAAAAHVVDDFPHRLRRFRVVEITPL